LKGRLLYELLNWFSDRNKTVVMLRCWTRRSSFDLSRYTLGSYKMRSAITMKIPRIRSRNVFAKPMKKCTPIKPSNSWNVSWNEEIIYLLHIYL